MSVEVEEFGFAMLRSVFSRPQVEALISSLPELDGAAGDRDLLRFDWCRDLAREERLTTAVRQAIGEGVRPIRAILFDKSAQANWNLGWHQDRKIAVAEKVEAPGFGAWSVKAGVIHCEPPTSILESCVAARIHLDDCGPLNGPLRVIPRSHLHGVQADVNPKLIDTAVECHARAGDVLLIKPLTWHASSKSADPSLHRRVIHIEYCGSELPRELHWAYM